MVENGLRKARRVESDTREQEHPICEVTMNRIAHLTGDDYLTLLENLERAKVARSSLPSHRSDWCLGDIGGGQLPFTPDYSHNVAGVGTLRGCETPEEERTVLPVDRCGLAVWLASLVMCVVLAFAAWVVEWLAGGE